MQILANKTNLKKGLVNHRTYDKQKKKCKILIHASKIFTYPKEIASRFNSYSVNIGPDIDLIMNTSAVYQNYP